MLQESTDVSQLSLFKCFAFVSSPLSTSSETELATHPRNGSPSRNMDGNKTLLLSPSRLANLATTISAPSSRRMKFLAQTLRLALLNFDAIHFANQTARLLKWNQLALSVRRSSFRIF
jgi:hypothetical protein